jgi:hypothetical protein
MNVARGLGPIDGSERMIPHEKVMSSPKKTSLHRFRMKATGSSSIDMDGDKTELIRKKTTGEYCPSPALSGQFIRHLK